MYGLKVAVAALVGLLLTPVAGATSRPTVVSCSTTKGPIKIEVVPEWAPLGAGRFLELVEDGFYTNIAFFRCVKGFLTQFGLSTDPSKKHWHRSTIQDDPHTGRPISKYVVSYAGSGPNSRNTQLFFAFEDLDFLGKAPWEVPFGHIVDGFEVMDHLYKGYGDIPPYGEGPDQQKIQMPGGELYLKENYPDLDYLMSCAIEDAESVPLLRGSEEAEADLEMQVEEHASEEAVQETREHIAENVNQEDPVAEGAVHRTQAEAVVPEVVRREPEPEPEYTEPETEALSDFAGMKPPPTAKKEEGVEANHDILEVKDAARLRAPSGHADDDDVAMLDSGLSDRTKKIRIIFLLLITVLGLLVYSIWRNRRKYRVGKLT